MGLSKSIGINANKNLAQTSRNLTRATEELMTGRKSSIKHVVSVLKGLQNESTAKVLEAVAESAKYGSTLLNVASSSLYNLLDDLTELRETIARAETGDSSTVANLTILYQNKVAAIISQLANGNFAGRYLYDGSMSSGTTAVPAQGVPNGAAPLTIRVGESFNNNVSIIIPKLLSGQVNAADTAVAGQFNPLFPTTAATTNAGYIAASIIAGDINTNPTYNPNILAAAAASTGNYNAVMAALLNPTTLPALTTAIATTATSLSGGSTQPNLDALGGTDAVKAAITTNITAILSNAAVSIANSAAAIDAAAVKTAIAASVNSFFSAGTLNTSANRKAADGVITAAMTTVNSLISSLNGQQSIIEGAIDSLTSSIAANKEAANDLLSANIVEAANEVKAILALIQSVYFVLGNIDQINQLNAILLRA